ncbi:MAG: butyrate kinase [Planctomycetota bacterium]
MTEENVSLTRNLILVINPGSTSTKLALFAIPGRKSAGPVRRDETVLDHPAEDIRRFPRIADQEGWRAELVEKYLVARGAPPGRLAAVAGRGGLLAPLAGGTYRVNAAMLRDLRKAARGEHACNLGAPIAARIARRAGCPAFVVDPPVVDELAPEARLSGLPDLPRRSVFHALSQKAAARMACDKLKIPYARSFLVVAHLGGGISVGAHRKGRVVEVNNALDGEGPFSPERAGTAPAGDLARLCFSGKRARGEILKMITGRGGLVAHLGTNNLLEVQARIRRGDRRAKGIFDAMAGGIARAIGAAAAALGRRPQAIVLVGAMARSGMLRAAIRRRVGFLAPVMAFPGHLEMAALAAGAWRVMAGREKAGDYRSGYRGDMNRKPGAKRRDRFVSPDGGRS